jgi:hypothetical protein
MGRKVTTDRGAPAPQHQTKENAMRYHRIDNYTTDQWTRNVWEVTVEFHDHVQTDEDVNEVRQQLKHLGIRLIEAESQYVALAEGAILDQLGLCDGGCISTNHFTITLETN